MEVGTNTALEAELHGSEEPALVVTDYLLGWTDGFDVMLRFRAIYPQCPIIVFTSVLDESFAVRSTAADTRRTIEFRGLTMGATFSVKVVTGRIALSR